MLSTVFIGKSCPTVLSTHLLYSKKRSLMEKGPVPFRHSWPFLQLSASVSVDIFIMSDLVQGR